MTQLKYLIRYEFLHRFDPYHEYLKQALRTTISCFLAILLYRFLPQYHEAYWSILSASFIIQTRIGNTTTVQITSVSLCGILAGLATLVAIIAATNTFFLAAYLGVIGILIGLSSIYGHHAVIRMFFIGLFAIMSAGLPLNDDSIWQRCIFILCGTFFASICSFLWPSNRLKHFKRVLHMYFHTVIEYLYQQLQLTIFDDKKIEERLHERRNRVLRQLRELRSFPNDLSNHSLPIAEDLFKLSVAFGNLRFLIKDNTRQIFLYAYLKLIPVFSSYINKKMLFSPPSFSVEEVGNIEAIDFYIKRLNLILKNEKYTD